MRIRVTIGALLVCSAVGATAQPFSQALAGKAFLDPNNLRTSVNAFGSMWYNETTQAQECEFPKGSGKHVGYAAAMWVGGKTAGDTLLAAAQLYRSGGRTDYYPGPLNSANASDTATAKLWNRVWSIKASVIQQFRNQAQIHPTPADLAAALTDPAYDAIKEWPAKGSTTAKGAGGQLLTSLATTPRECAPFVDVDGDGKYDYTRGDYPLIKGDAALWTVYNDATAAKTQTGTAAIGLEVHLSAYAYARGTAVDDMQFYEYQLVNYGQRDLDSTRVAIWTDADLGYAFDDFIGFDSTRRMGYIYNGDSVDGNGTSSASYYGTNPPAAGVVLLETVGDNFLFNTIAPVGAFTFFSNTGAGVPACLADPGNGEEFYRYMTGRTRCGDPFVNDFTGVAGVHTTGHGTGPVSPYVFNGNPSVAGQWSECYSRNPPGDRRFILSSAPFKLPGKGEVRKVAFALVASSNVGGCGAAINLSGLQAAADTAHKVYRNPPDPAPAPAGVAGVLNPDAWRVYPNPTDAFLTVETTGTGPAQLAVYDVNGRRMAVPVQEGDKKWRVDASGLAPGLFAVRITGAGGTETRTFVKR